MPARNIPKRIQLQLFCSCRCSTGRNSAFLLAVLLLLMMTPSNLAAKINVQGISGELKANVEAFLTSVSDQKDENPERYRNQLIKASEEALQALGYYEPLITATLETDQDSPSTTIQIDSGSPVRVTELNLILLGAAEEDAAFQKMMTDHPLKIGDPFHHGKYESLKSGFTDLAISRGYFDAEFLASKTEISIKDRSARVTLRFDSRQRYQFGLVSISGAPELEEIIRATQNFQSGEPYSGLLMAEYNANLNDTNYFRSVLVRPDLDNLSNEVVPIIIQATPYARNIVKIGGGISTDIGLRGTLKWTVPRLNRAGHSLTSGVEVSTPEQQIIASYKIPLEDAHTRILPCCRPVFSAKTIKTPSARSIRYKPSA